MQMQIFFRVRGDGSGEKRLLGNYPLASVVGARRGGNGETIPFLSVYWRNRFWILKGILGLLFCSVGAISSAKEHNMRGDYMRGHFRCKALLVGLMTVLLPCAAQTATILFGEPSTEGGNSSFLVIDANGNALPMCVGAPPVGGCVGASTMNVESTSVTVQFPVGALGGNLSATAYLLEPAFEVPGGLAISDRLNLAVSSGVGTFDFVMATFTSDNQSGNQGSIAPNFPVGLRVPEDGTLQELTSFFFTGSDTAPVPVGAALPGGTRIFAQSDIVPEPSGMLLPATGLIILIGNRLTQGG